MCRFLTDKEIRKNKCRDCIDLERIRTYLNRDKSLACPYKVCPYTLEGEIANASR